MSWEDVQEYIQYVQDRMPVQPFRPYLYYQKDGDILEFKYEDEAGVYCHIAPGFGVLMSVDRDKIIGFSITGASRLVHDGSITLHSGEEYKNIDVPCPHCEAPLAHGSGFVWEGAKCPKCMEVIEWDGNSWIGGA